MIVTEFFDTRFDGVKLYRTYSDIKHYIIQHPTEIEYEEAVDIEGAEFTYTESEKVIPDPEEEVLTNDN